MGKAGHLARHAAQAEAGIARIVGGFQSPVVEGESLAGDELEVKLTIVAAAERLASERLRFVGRELAGLINVRAGIGEGRHRSDIASIADLPTPLRLATPAAWQVSLPSRMRERPGVGDDVSLRQRPRPEAATGRRRQPGRP